jgi:poly(3-hydroxybutyrate) depolymerase
MLYSLYEFQHLAMMPWRVMSDTARELLTHPLVPMSHTHLGRSLAAGLEVIDSATKHRGKPEWGLDRTLVEGEEVALNIERVTGTPFCDLQHFKRLGVERADPAILLVAPMSGHHATLLRGTVEALVPDHEVYVTDWLDARLVPTEAGPFGLEDYLDTLIGFMKKLGPDLHVMAVCQPAPLVLAAVSLLAQADDPAQPKSMILMGGPVDTRAAPTAVTRFAESRSLAWFEHALVSEVPAYYPGGGRRVYPGFLQLGSFISMNPSRHFESHLKAFRHLVQGDGDSVEAHNRFYDEYLAVMDVAADYYLETVDEVFKRHTLPNGEMTWRGQTIDPAAITKTALMTVEGELDDISAPGQTIAAHAMCANLDQAKHENLLQAGVGHYGIFNGRRWREKIKPAIGAFVREHA